MIPPLYCFSVYCLDYYGQGENARTNEKVLRVAPRSSFRLFVFAIDELVQMLKTTSVPTYVIGSSLGLFILQDYIQRFGNHIEKAILIGSNGPDYRVKLNYALARSFVSPKAYTKKSSLLAAMLINLRIQKTNSTGWAIIKGAFNNILKTLIQAMFPAMDFIVSFKRG